MKRHHHFNHARMGRRVLVLVSAIAASLVAGSARADVRAAEAGLEKPADHIDAIRRFSDFSWTQLSSLQVRVATRCLDDWQHVAAVRDGLADRLERLRAVVTALGFEAYPTDAGMYLLCRAPAAVGDRRVGRRQARFEALQVLGGEPPTVQRAYGVCLQIGQ